MKKEEKKKVGRPKLADIKLKRESILVILFAIVCVSIIGVFSYKVLKMEFVPSKVEGLVFNKNINTCIFEDNYIKCGPNVTYMKYSNDNKTYKEYKKDITNILVEVSSKENLRVCYKNNSKKTICKYIK